MQCQHNIVKHQVEELYKSTPARSTEVPDFYQYSLDVNTVIFQGTYSSIYMASHAQRPDLQMVGRVYEPTARIDVQRSSYMKVLKHINGRSPHCIATYDIFYDDAGRVVIFQEFAVHSNLKDYLKTNNVYVPEPQLREWAVQVYRGMDFLGDAGICHRAISPKHILLTPNPEDENQTLAKLGSFRDSFIYFDPLLSTVRTLPSREKKESAGANFKAPETFINEAANPDEPEAEYDPISADVWSYGATFFFANSRNFPVKYNSVRGDISASIQKAINYAKNLSGEGKQFFAGLLQVDPLKRTTFDQIATEPWFKKADKAMHE